MYQQEEKLEEREVQNEVRITFVVFHQNVRASEGQVAILLFEVIVSQDLEAVVSGDVVAAPLAKWTEPSEQSEANGDQVEES